MDDINPCNFLYNVVKDSSRDSTPLPFQVRMRILNTAVSVNRKIRIILNPQKPMADATSPAISPSQEINPLNLQQGEWVQVKSIEEITQTLDYEKKYKGLYFMPEMEKFCGKKFRVFKQVKIIKLEPTGEVRKLKSPTVFLEGVYCNGKTQNGCDRSCFHFWKEAWLKRSDEFP
jgi:hypothetical protein